MPVPAPAESAPTRPLAPKKDRLMSRTTWIWMFEELKKQYDEEVVKNPQVGITITLKDGSTRIGTAWETTPMTIAPETWTDRISISKVNNFLWDLDRPFEIDSSVECFDSICQKDDMFTIGLEKETFALKRMNCPSHCLIFKSRERSYRELPWTMADFGVLHRNEYSGALTGLTLVRGFQQYDIHIFCTQDQIEDEITGVLDFLKHIYGIFGFTFELELSTPLEKFLGEIETWTDAEKQLSVP
ncbi:hypothetical protein V1505DRAFT_358635 [Lipomyces doorenjongii]